MIITSDRTRIWTELGRKLHTDKKVIVQLQELTSAYIMLFNEPAFEIKKRELNEHRDRPTVTNAE